MARYQDSKSCDNTSEEKTQTNEVFTLEDSSLVDKKVLALTEEVATLSNQVQILQEHIQQLEMQRLEHNMSFCPEIKCPDLTRLAQLNHLPKPAYHQERLCFTRGYRLIDLKILRMVLEKAQHCKCRQM